jgi:predicted small metal-binding protein
MKQIACAQMGGPATCTVTFSGNTPEEIVQEAMKHVEASHPDLAAQIKAMTPEETSKWMADFRPKFDALPEM